MIAYGKYGKGRGWGDVGRKNSCCGLVMVDIWVLRDGRTRALCVEARCDLGVGCGRR